MTGLRDKRRRLLIRILRILGRRRRLLGRARYVRFFFIMGIDRLRGASWRKGLIESREREIR
jgi:hypothetical protein